MSKVKDCAELGLEHDWVEAVEGPDVVGKVCARCGAVDDQSGDFYDNYL